MKNLFLSCSVIILVFAACSKKITKPLTVFSNESPLERKVDSVLKLMTLEEKVGQLNQYNGFWEITGPTPKEGQAAKK